MYVYELESRMVCCCCRRRQEHKSECGDGAALLAELVWGAAEEQQPWEFGRWKGRSATAIQRGLEVAAFVVVGQLTWSG